MNDRDEQLLRLRPDLRLSPATLPNEQFQNSTLRPILRFQHEAILHAWQRYVRQQKDVFTSLPKDKREPYIRHALQKNKALREHFLGIVTGMFTTEEYAYYDQYEREIAKRIYSLIAQRLSSLYA